MPALGRVLLDFTLFRRLRVRGEALNVQAGEPHLRAALELVTGRPFTHSRGPGAYAWLAQAGWVDHIEAAVMDTATRLADIYLAVGDLEAARWVEAQARLVDDRGEYDQPYRILMRITHAEGNQAQIRAHLDDLRRRRDLDDDGDLDPVTSQLVARLLPHRRSG